MYSLTHQKEREDGEYDHIPQGNYYNIGHIISAILDIDTSDRYQYYITIYTATDTNVLPIPWEIDSQENADEWLEQFSAEDMIPVYNRNGYGINFKASSSRPWAIQIFHDYLTTKSGKTRTFTNKEAAQQFIDKHFS